MTNQKTAARRERRITTRKVQILEAAANVFREKGYGRATTKEIADAADVSEGTLYNYFNNKRDLLIGLVQDFTNETIAGIAEIQAEGIEELMFQVMTHRLKKMRHKRLITLFLHEARMDPVIHQYYVEEMLGRFVHELEGRLRVLINAGIMRPINPAITARTIVCAMTGLAIIFDVGDDAILQEISDEALAKEMLDFFKHGLYPCPADKEGDAA
jgi:AcrR family transcriptional regulator